MCLTVPGGGYLVATHNVTPHHSLSYPITTHTTHLHQQRQVRMGLCRARHLLLSMQQALHGSLMIFFLLQGLISSLGGD